MKKTQNFSRGIPKARGYLNNLGTDGDNLKTDLKEI